MLRKENRLKGCEWDKKRVRAHQSDFNCFQSLLKYLWFLGSELKI